MPSFVCVCANMGMQRSRFADELVHVVMVRNMLSFLIGYQISGNVISEQNVDTRVEIFLYPIWNTCELVELIFDYLWAFLIEKVQQ